MIESFEQKLAKIESIIEELKSDDTPLNKTIEDYKIATSLIDECHKELITFSGLINKIIPKTDTTS